MLNAIDQDARLRERLKTALLRLLDRYSHSTDSYIQVGEIAGRWVKWSNKQQWLNRLSEELRKLAEEDGKLPAFAWPGGYPILYLDKDMEVICPKCANDHGKDITLVAHDVHWEGESEYCAECNAEIESAYGVPEQE